VTVPSFKARAEAWAAPPVDDIGYILSSELLTWNDEALADAISAMSQSRYQGWRNWEMRWRNVLGLDRTRGKTVLDYGCGVGLEALQYAKLGNNVWLADIAPTNLKLATRVLGLENYKIAGSYLISEYAPFVNILQTVDVIHCCGVLHHIPDPQPVVEHMANWLNDDGELRLMVYSDEAWRIATHSDPLDDPVENSELFRQYWTHWDPIGGYADWYDSRKLEAKFGEWFTLESCEYLTEHGEYLGAVLRRR
jgi:SAM-dependent methyltransferase